MKKQFTGIMMAMCMGMCMSMYSAFPCACHRM